ncbi:sporulation protein [Parageobacillus thermoglucosidasius]|uniref:Sporulation protein n=2 Tax=Anoxybacillaceae TaxID=3120669 RepID=A0A1B7KPD6_PARTM|nr:sporulation protein [Parageobacillus thermoglucosidasius]
MSMRKWLFATIVICVWMGGCAKEQEVKQQSLQGSGFMKTNTNGAIQPNNMNQQTAERAVALIKARDDIKDAVAVNTSKKLLVAYQIKHMHRFYRKQIEKEIERQLIRLFPNYQTVSSSDLKIFWKTEELREKLGNKNWNEQKVDQQIEKIRQLSEERT